MSWNLKGTYFETCNCEVACPCVFLSPPTEGECQVLVAWHVDQGKDGEVGLDGLNVAMAITAPGHHGRDQVEGGALSGCSARAMPRSRR